NAKLRSIALRPSMHGLQESFIQQFSQRCAPVTTNGRRLRTKVADEGWKIWLQIVAAAFAELLEEVYSPVRVVDLQTVAKNRVRRLRTKRLQQPVADLLQIIVNRGLIKMVEHESFGADCWPFHLLTGAA